MQLVDSIIYNNVEYKINDYIHYISKTNNGKNILNKKGKILYIDNETKSILLTSKINSKEYAYDFILFNHIVKKIENQNYKKSTNTKNNELSIYNFYLNNINNIKD